MTDSVDQESILVLGLGNLLWADEGFGIRVVEALYARYTFAENVDILDGGTQGLLLLPRVEQAKRMIVVDAIDFALTPGTLHVVRDGRIPVYLSAKKMSLHQTGFSEVLALAELQGCLPQEIVLIGVQPVVLDDYGGSLSSLVREQIEVAVAAVVGQLKLWGAVPAARADTAHLNLAGLELQRYENERPSAESACRIGDARVLQGSR